MTQSRTLGNNGYTRRKNPVAAKTVPEQDSAARDPASLWANPGFRADRLVVARRRLGMSQGELAGRLGVDQSTVSRLERGEMQSPPWKLVVQSCLHLKLEPHALMDVNAGLAETCRPLSIVRARISHHFLYLGSFGRLPEMLHYCLYDMSHVRPTIAGVSLLLFNWPDAVTRTFYAQFQGGQVSFAGRNEKAPLTEPIERLRELWQAGTKSRRPRREEIPGWEPALALDLPLTHGMLGLDFSAEEYEEPDTDVWAEHLAETFERGLALAGERRGTENADDMRDITTRLMALEQRLQ
jgi:DNA-binding XRE family transcriptional regulator